MTLPTGDLVAGPGDLFVVHSDGDLWLHPGALTSAPGNPVRLADLTDPRIPWGPEGSGPNTVEDVAGEVDGVVYYSDCCEPIMGDLLAATSESSERILLGAGYSPVLDPTRIKLATVNNNELAVIDLTNGEYRGLVLNDPGAWIEPWDLIWTPDGTALVVLSFENAEWGLTRFAAAPPFEQGEKVPLGLAFDPAAGFDVQIAGRGPNGEIAVVVDDDKATVLRYFDQTTLAEVSGPQPSLPPNIRSVRLADDGVSLLWVDDTTLRYLPAGGDTRDLGDGFVAAWFA